MAEDEEIKFVDRVRKNGIEYEIHDVRGGSGEKQTCLVRWVIQPTGDNPVMIQLRKHYCFSINKYYEYYDRSAKSIATQLGVVIPDVVDESSLNEVLNLFIPYINANTTLRVVFFVSLFTLEPECISAYFKPNVEATNTEASLIQSYDDDFGINTCYLSSNNPPTLTRVSSETNVAELLSNGGIVAITFYDETQN